MEVSSFLSFSPVSPPGAPPALQSSCSEPWLLLRRLCSRHLVCPQEDWQCSVDCPHWCLGMNASLLAGGGRDHGATVASDLDQFPLGQEPSRVG